MNPIKSVTNRESLYNLLSNYNNLVEGQFKFEHINFIKNANVNHVVINDSLYDFESIASGTTIANENFTIANWFSSTSSENTISIGMDLDHTEVGSLTKLQLQSLVDIPFDLTTINNIYQEFEIDLKKDSEYIFAVLYQITNSSGIIKAVEDKNLNISIEIDSSGWSAIDSDDFTEEETGWQMIKSTNYTYIKYIAIKNLDTFTGIQDMKVILESSSDDTDLVIIQNVLFYEGDTLSNIVKPQNLSLLDSIRYNEKKKWELSNDGGKTFQDLQQPAGTLQTMSFKLDYTFFSQALNYKEFTIALPSQNTRILDIQVIVTEEIYCNVAGEEDNFGLDVRCGSVTYPTAYFRYATARIGGDPELKYVGDSFGIEAVNAITPFPYAEIHTRTNNVDVVYPVFKFMSWGISGSNQGQYLMDQMNGGEIAIHIVYLDPTISPIYLDINDHLS